ncbi:dnaJ homolog subfamily C member 22-like [Oppia nitens]|uniref:dnaJ homolog subfamily C member 22-like n=1 Tax=Oppia nitens TaxID=1686743 RepID=UPI0023DB7F05|nr:dnaJ homolog subfamily C member 22-like [Oppia nitens]
MAKSLFVTYFLWLFFGLFGLHQFYLNRDIHSFLMWMTFGGYFGCGWVRDLWRIPEYVKDANNDPKYLEILAEKMRKEAKPSTGYIRASATIIIADILGYLVVSAIPIELFSEDSYWITLLTIVLAPFAVAVGVYAVGNVGRQRGSLKGPLIGAYLTAPLYLFSQNVVFWTSLSSNYFFNNYSKQWRRTPPKRRSLCRRISILIFFGLIYLSLWSSWFYFNCSVVDKNEEEIKCRDAAKNFLKSPIWKECTKVFDELKLYIQIHGWSGLWREIVSALDPQGESNALKVLNLPQTATQEEITSTYRRLSRQWHPDKHKDPNEKIRAQEMFIEIQNAYEILSKIKRQRIKSRNSFDEND